jgi:hypothetical protein
MLLDKLFLNGYGSMSHVPAPHSETNHDEWNRTLVQDWQWEYNLDGTRYRVFIPKGVEYDPSIPTVAESVVPEDRLFIASLPHDVFYKLQGDLSQTDYAVLSSRWQDKWHRHNRVSRLYADRLFYKIAQQTGVSWWRRKLAWWGVRSRWGQKAWDEEDDFTLP